MTDLVLRDIDPQLAARIRKVAETNGWTIHQTILHLIERGLFASEGGALRFDSAESDVMQSAIAALESVPNDPGFSLIGRVRGDDPVQSGGQGATGAVTDAPSPAMPSSGFDPAGPSQAGHEQIGHAQIGHEQAGDGQARRGQAGFDQVGFDQAEFEAFLAQVPKGSTLGGDRS